MKCKSQRSILLLFVGILAGFLICTILQNLVLNDSISRYSDRALSPLNTQDVRFANLDQPNKRDLSPPESTIDSKANIILGAEEKPQKIILSRMPETISIHSESDDVRQQNSDLQTLATNKEVKQDDKKDYETWRQGRNVQNLHTKGQQILKLSDELMSRQPLLVAIITSVQQLMSQTISIHSTWGKRAKHVLYFTGDVQTMPHLPHGMEIVQLEGIDDKQASWDIKEFAVIKYLTSHYVEDVDWFLVIGDDVFVNSEALKNKLEDFNASFQVYMGRSIDNSGEHKKCSPATGIVYSRGLLSRLEAYLPQCQGEHQPISQCILHRGIECTQAEETHELFFLDHKRLVETNKLFTTEQLTRALTIQPIRYPKYMYRLYSYFLELAYNTSTNLVKNAISEIHVTHPFVPTHLRSPFKLRDEEKTKTTKQEAVAKQAPPIVNSQASNIVVRPRHVPKNKFEVSYWEYFNQTRFMSVYHEQPSRGIIGGLREEARYALTKAIYLANQGLSPDQRLIFEKLENGYHRVDPMRGSEYILDFVFRKSSDRNMRVKKRVGLLRPYHETVVPVPTAEQLNRVNFVVTLSGLSNRLEQFLANFEKNILNQKEDATLTIALFEGSDKAKVHGLADQYNSRYSSSPIKIIDLKGEFARGVGLHHGAVHFKEHELLFLVDVDLEINNEFLRRCRLNTIRSKQVYFPIFYKLYNLEFVNKYYRGNDSQFLSRKNGHWAHYSYGMVCIYASDYQKSGGYNIEMRGWGEEDIDLLNRVMSAGLEIFRAPDPGLIHLWHRKICNKEAILSSKGYLHCLQSKAENLADRTELAQYIFEKELKEGNVI